MPDKMRNKWIMGVIKSNAKVPFIDRMINPKNYPVMQRPDLGQGATSTHLMSYGTDDKGAFAYPEIIYDNRSGSLRRLNRRQAMEHSMITGENIRFNTEKEAEDFTQNYKKALGWEK